MSARGPVWMVFPRNQDLGSLGEYLKISYSLEHCPSAVFSTSKYLETQSGRNVGKKSLELEFLSGFLRDTIHLLCSSSLDLGISHTH